MFKSTSVWNVCERNLCVKENVVYKVAKELMYTDSDGF